MNHHEQENPIRLFLLEAHTLVRVSLGRLLAAQPGFQVVGECGLASEALKMLAELPADIVLLDFNFGADHAADFMAAARSAGYQGRFLIITAQSTTRTAIAALKSGAAGIFLNSDDPDLLQAAIRLVFHGGAWLSQTVVQLLTNDVVNWYSREGAKATDGPLTERQSEVLLGISEGLTNKTIGKNLGLSEGSVKSVIQQLFYKCGVRTRSQLVRLNLDGSLRAPSAFSKQIISPAPQKTAKSKNRKSKPNRRRTDA